MSRNSVGISYAKYRDGDRRLEMVLSPTTTFVVKNRRGDNPTLAWCIDINLHAKSVKGDCLLAVWAAFLKREQQAFRKTLAVLKQRFHSGMDMGIFRFRPTPGVSVTLFAHSPKEGREIPEALDRLGRLLEFCEDVHEEKTKEVATKRQLLEHADLQGAFRRVRTALPLRTLCRPKGKRRR